MNVNGVKNVQKRDYIHIKDQCFGIGCWGGKIKIWIFFPFIKYYKVFTELII